MLSATAVTIIVNGSIVPSFSPARLVNGRVLAPLTPIVVRLASRTTYDAVRRTITIESAGLRVIVPVIFVEDEMPYVEVGVVVRAIGGTTDYDSPLQTLTIGLPAPPIALPPIDDRAPAERYREPSLVRSPLVTTPVPRIVQTNAPRPRRTAIPAAPSEPIDAPTAAAPATALPPATPSAAPATPKGQRRSEF